MTIITQIAIIINKNKHIARTMGILIPKHKPGSLLYLLPITCCFMLNSAKIDML